MIKLKDMKEDIMEILPFTELLNASEKKYADGKRF